LTVAKTDAETATATVTHALVPPVGFPIPEGAEAVFLREGVETLQLKLGADTKKWQIVPPETAPPINAGDGFDNSISRAVYMLAQKSELKLANEKAKVSMTNMKQLSLGVLMFAQDYDDRYAFAPQYLQEAILPYVKSKELFLVPGSQEAYSFNANLSDQSIADLKEPSKTVMFYEGADEKPTFRYDGKAAIGFADGHVVLVSPEDAKNLIWKP
jgi:prepilin-type processing-associated H-X9-DG protein